MTKSSSSKKGTEGLTERATYAYDYRGLLVKKTYSEFTADEGVSITGGSTASVTEWYEYTQDGRLLYTEKSSGSEVKKTDYIWAETTLWCEVDDGEVYYHHTDHLGTTEAVTDSKGKVVWHAEYEAFGSVLSENGSMAFTPSFTGKMLDECSGLYYFNARWYDSECGRFTTSDPVRDGAAWYVYCKNSPVVHIDPDGKTPVLSLTLEEAIKIALAKGTPKLALAAADGPGLLVDIAVTVWLCYDVYQIYKDLSIEKEEQANTNKKEGYNGSSVNKSGVSTPSAPPPNNGDGKKHGNDEHNDDIDDRLKKAKDEGGTDIRKNQAQVDAEGNKVGDNRPDGQWNDIEGKHHCYETDHNPKNSIKHGEVISKHDPDAIVELNVIQ